MKRINFMMSIALAMAPLAAHADDISRDVARGLEADLRNDGEDVLRLFTRYGSVGEQPVKDMAMRYQTTKIQLEMFRGAGSVDGPDDYAEVPGYLLIKALGFTSADLDTPYQSLAGVQYRLPTTAAPQSFYQSGGRR